MELSVVLACKYEARRLSTMLTSLTRQSWEGSWEVIVADNGSTRLPGLAVVDASAGRGAGYARNRGVEHSSGEKLLFLDATTRSTTACGALKRLSTMEGAALSAAIPGRLIGQLTDIPMF